MAVSVENLEDLVLNNIRNHDSTTIVSGYFSPDILEAVASIGKPVNFYYGMYLWSHLSELQYNKFKDIENNYPNMKIKVVTGYHVHTKCYIFSSPNGTNALVGSANCSSAGLLSERNSEMLIDVNDSALIADLITYAKDVDQVSTPYTDPSIIPYKRKSVSSRKVYSSQKGRIFSGDPFVDNIPLYIIDKQGKKVVPPKSGINWGLQSGKHKKSQYAEAYIPIKAFDLKNNGAMFPPCGALGSGSGGKNTRRTSPVTVVWDDGTVMQMHLQGTVPKKGIKKKAVIYPKQLTSDSGGAELGEYLRRRMNIPGRQLITMKDFKKYGRDFITLTYIGPGNYEADFHV